MSVKITPIPYRGMGPAQTDAIAGTVQVLMDQAPSVLQHVKSGKLSALAVMAPKRLAELPNVPTQAPFSSNFWTRLLRMSVT